ncbi:caspase-1-like isoform X2 [Mizuhopecten yessoensis]|uniref:caspase-1-like isoform X2 n=1 Tax=Mizuhopecten yessoensis TaxID=6573 RepID=UPI000B45D3FB|nr:caspase-1-like isoform X2 [Mizuhopecten yessoensis]
MRDPDKEKEQKVAEVEHSPKSEEEKKIPEQSPENVTQKAETEDSKNCKEKRESQEQPPEKGQNGSDTEEERGSRTDLDEEDVVPEHSYADRARSDTAFDHINMMGFIDRKHKFSSWPNRSSMKVPDTTPEHYKVSRPVENVRLGEYKMTRTPRGKAVIFNIENFRKSQNHATDEPIKDRTGSSIDADGLVKVFNHLHFDVERFDDFSFNEINGRLRNLGEETDHDNVDCIAIFILTHGQNGKTFRCKWVSV